METPISHRPSTYCEFTGKVFFADEHAEQGGLIRSMQPKYLSQDHLLDYRVVYDLKSKYLRITALKARYSRSLKNCTVYAGLNSGEILLLQIKDNKGEQMARYPVFCDDFELTMYEVNHIDFLEPQQVDHQSQKMFTVVAASSKEKTPLVFLGATSENHK